MAKEKRMKVVNSKIHDLTSKDKYSIGTFIAKFYQNVTPTQLDRLNQLRGI